MCDNRGPLHKILFEGFHCNALWNRNEFEFGEWVLGMKELNGDLCWSGRWPIILSNVQLYSKRYWLCLKSYFVSVQHSPYPKILNSSLGALEGDPYQYQVTTLSSWWDTMVTRTIPAEMQSDAITIKYTAFNHWKGDATNSVHINWRWVELNLEYKY